MREGIMRYLVGSKTYEVNCDEALSNRFIGAVLSRITTDIFDLRRNDDG